MKVLIFMTFLILIITSMNSYLYSDKVVRTGNFTNDSISDNDGISSNIDSLQIAFDSLGAAFDSLKNTPGIGCCFGVCCMILLIVVVLIIVIVVLIIKKS